MEWWSFIRRRRNSILWHHNSERKNSLHHPRTPNEEENEALETQVNESPPLGTQRTLQLEGAEECHRRETRRDLFIQKVRIQMQEQVRSGSPSDAPLGVLCVQKEVSVPE